MSFHSHQSARSPSVLDAERPLPQARLSWPKAFTSHRRSARVSRRAQRPALCQHSKQSGRASTQSSHAPAATSLRDYSVQERTDVSTQEHFVDQGERQPETFSWTRQWYPLAAVDDLDDTRPHAAQLLGMRLVLWRDAGGDWRCFEDLCPHRKVPLSEGSVEKDGSLMCGYHGWRWNGEGKAICIPQVGSLDKKAEATACASRRSAATTYPTQVLQGLIWVWAEPGPLAFIESAASTPILDPMRTQAQNWSYGFKNYIRDVPGDFSCYIENMTDQSHVSWAHHGAAGNREGKRSGYFKVTRMEQHDEPARGFNFTFDWSGNSKSVSKGTTYTFTPPHYNGFNTGGRKSSLWIYAVPTSSTSTRLIINSGTDGQVNLPWRRRLMRALQPRWASHLVLNAVNDGDIIFMHEQSRHNQAVQPRDWTHHYFTPGDSDKGVMAFRKWLTSLAGGGPAYAGPQPPEAWFSGLGRLRRRELLDRYSQHTLNCASCRQALWQTEVGQKAAVGVMAAAALIATIMLGRGAPLLSLPVGGCAAAAAAAMWALLKLRRLHASLTFTDWVIAEKHAHASPPEPATV